MEPLNEHFLKVHKIFSKFQTEIEWNGKKQIRGCFSIEVVSKYTQIPTQAEACFYKEI